MKTKLTLTVRKDIIEKAKRAAKSKGVSVSKLFEEVFDKKPAVKTEEQKAMERLRALLAKSKPVQALPESDKELYHKHIKEKYG
jgi:hypothetical protein